MGKRKEKEEKRMRAGGRKSLKTFYIAISKIN